jgi:hypothetical protein
MYDAYVRAVFLYRSTKWNKVIVVRKEKKAVKSGSCREPEGIAAYLDVDPFFAFAKTI